MHNCDKFIMILLNSALKQKKTELMHIHYLASIFCRKVNHASTKVIWTHLKSLLWSVAAGAKNLFGGRKQTESTGDLVQAPWSFFFLHPNDLWTGIFVKIKPNFLSSRDIALASTLISTCLSTDELLLSGMRVVENGPITWHWITLKQAN